MVTETLLPTPRAVHHEPPRLRVAYVVHTFDTGGLERCVANLCNHLDLTRFEPLVICLNRSGNAVEWITRGDIRVIELRKGAGNDPRVIGSLAKALRDFHVDIVHSHNWGTLIETTLARRWAGVPVHVHAERGTVCGRTRPGRRRSRWRAQAMRWALSRADCVVSNAASVARRVEQACGYPSQRVRLILNGVEQPYVKDAVAARREVRRELSIPDQAFVIGSVGRLVPVKGFDLAVEALARLVHAGPDAHLILVGDGPERESLRERAEAAQISGRLHLVGQLSDVGRYLASFDIYINTSHSEGMSQSLVEAMAAGLPLIVTDVGDSRALMDGGASCGRVIPARDASLLADAVRELADAPGLHDRLGRNARARYEECYPVDRMAQGYASLYTQLARARA